MKKLIVLLPFILFSCSQESSTTFKSTTSSDSDTSSVDMIEKTEMMLEKTEGLEEEVKETYHTKEVLTKENKVLKNELIHTKEELNKVTNELIETKSKLPKKQNFIQKVFSITPDSIEVTTFDTIQK